MKAEEWLSKICLAKTPADVVRYNREASLPVRRVRGAGAPGFRLRRLCEIEGQSSGVLEFLCRHTAGETETAMRVKNI